MKNNEEHIIELQTLLSRNTDAVKGFKQVAESASNESLQTFFHMNALEREGFVTDLGERIKQLGESPEDEFNLQAYLHRKWIDIKSLVNSASKEEMIAECKRGADSMIADYMAAVESGKLDVESRRLIGSQLQAIQQHAHRIELIK
jgi:uncharacterized protein (TIGR02284 family)